MGAGIAVEGVRLAQRSELGRDSEVEALFDRHYAPLCRLAYVILGDGPLAEEIVMEAMLKTFTGWVRIRSGSILGPWLNHAVANVTICLSVAGRTAGV